MQSPPQSPRGSQPVGHPSSPLRAREEAITYFQAHRTLTPDGIAVLEAVLRDHEWDAVRSTGSGPDWNGPVLREQHGVSPTAAAALVRERAGYGVDVCFAWYCAEALDVVAGSNHRERLIAEWGREALGLDSPVIEDEDEDEEEDI